MVRVQCGKSTLACQTWGYICCRVKSYPNKDVNIEKGIVRDRKINWEREIEREIERERERDWKIEKLSKEREKGGREEMRKWEKKAREIVKVCVCLCVSVRERERERERENQSMWTLFALLVTELLNTL